MRFPNAILSFCASISIWQSLPSSTVIQIMQLRM